MDAVNKYIAFDLYRKNDKGGHEKALQLQNQPNGVQVALIADVEVLEQALRVAFKWLHANVKTDVESDKVLSQDDGFSPSYLNDLADMRAARSLMVR